MRAVLAWIRGKENPWTDDQSEEVISMAPTKEKAIVMTIEVESGKIVEILPINGAERREMQEGELKEAYANFGAGFDTVCLVIRSHNSPGCLRVIGGSLVKVC